MKKILLLAALFSLLVTGGLEAQSADSADVYLITCAPGTASYSIYGHTALRISMQSTQFDMVYNWGIFDFSTPNFVYRFAKGKLDYMLGAYSYERFLEEYVAEGRAVWSQRNDPAGPSGGSTVTVSTPASRSRASCVGRTSTW